MCHMSPTAQILGLLVTIITTIFTVWHIWCFDRGRCMLFSRKNLFRWAILMMLTAALCCLVIWSGMLTWVKYHEYYAVVPHGDGSMIRPVPFQLWSPERQNFIRGAYHVASIGWGLLAAVHAEETLYWAYLIGSIRKRDSKSWFSSVHFKIWVGCVISAMSIAPGAGFIETEDLNEMEHYIFFVGATFAVILFVASIWLLLVFPTFIAESRRRGANPEVLARLQYFKELNTARTVFRFFYALCLLTLSIDAFTEHKAVNASPFWTDVLFILAYFCALTSTAIAIMILLPRSMANESGAPKTTALYVNPPPQLSGSPYAHHPYTKQNDPDHQSDTDVSADGTTLAPPRRASFGVSVRSSMPFANEPLSPWGALGERLNIGHEKMGWAEGDMEMAGGGRNGGGGGGGGGSYGMSSGPFAAQPGSTVVRPGEEVHSVPRQLNEFRGPLDVEPREPVDLSKILVTSETVVEKHY